MQSPEKIHSLEFELVLMRGGFPVSDNPKYSNMNRTNTYLAQRKICSFLAFVFRKTADWFELRSGQVHQGKLLQA